MKTENNCVYYDITKRDKDAAIRYLISCIVQARQACGFPSNTYEFDEDVNVYLAHLLFAVSLPEYYDITDSYLAEGSSGLMQMVQETEDPVVKYYIYKVNADHLLVHTTIFDDLSAGHRHRFFKSSPKYYRELAKLYYEQATILHQKIYRQKTGVKEVLGKIARHFKDYQNLLRLVRAQYFGYFDKFRERAFKGLAQEINRYEQRFQLERKMDEFLDHYGEWLKSRRRSGTDELIRLTEEIKTLDPDFQCDIFETPLNEGDAA